MKRLAVINDTHCGSRFGLAPPEWQGSRTDESYKGRVEKRQFKVMCGTLPMPKFHYRLKGQQ